MSQVLIQYKWFNEKSLGCVVWKRNGKKRRNCIVLEKIILFWCSQSSLACHRVKRKSHLWDVSDSSLYFFLLPLLCFCVSSMFLITYLPLFPWDYFYCDLSRCLCTLSHVGYEFAFVWTVCCFASPVQTFARSKPHVDNTPSVAVGKWLSYNTAAGC